MTAIGTTWHYDLRIPATDSIVPLKITASFDTVILSTAVTSLTNVAKWLPRESGVSLPEYTYIYHSNAKYYIYDFNRDQFQLLLDSNWQVGDTFIFQWGNQIDTMLVKQANINSGTPSLRRHQLNKISNGIETGGITAYLPGGYSDGFIPRFANGLSDSIDHIRCYNSPHGFSFDLSAFGCDVPWVINNIEKSNSLKSFSIFPNPSSSGIFNFNMVGNVKELNLQVYDARGQEIKGVQLDTNNQQIVLPQNQLYFLVVTDWDGGSKTFKLTSY